MQPKRSNLCSGFSLIEAVTAVAIVASVLALLVTAQARFKKQDALAQQKLAALAALDEQLAEWWTDQEFPAHRTSGLTRQGGYRWGSSWRDAPPPLSELAILRIEVRQQEQDESLAVVELLMQQDDQP